MAQLQGLTRRSLLYGSAVAAGGAALAACSSGDGGSGAGSGSGTGSSGEPAAPTGKGSEAKPLPKPAKFAESPLLAEQVKAGKLPAVEERLPENPYVLPHRWTVTGNYGGTMQMVQGKSESSAVKEYMYGGSPLRFLNDGLDIGPGLVETWESNADASEWTFNFRKGLKWSDGKPWTTESILYWWEDLVQNEDHPFTPPDDVRSGKDTVAKLTCPDDTTMVLTFDAPAPVTPERIAAWVNQYAETGTLGPLWMLPKHYVQQFHPKYNTAIKAGSDWFSNHDLKADFQRNPDCPTMTGWRGKAYREGQSLTLERNPFYWVVDKEGKQLPYIDEVNFTVVKDEQVQKLNMTQGKYDYIHGGHHPIVLGDVSTFKQAEAKTGVRLRFWDSGSGTGSMLFFNYDHPDAKLRALFRNNKFQKALSHAVNRAEIRKAIYYDTGEATTGTLSVKGVIFNVNDEGKKLYEQWRDLAVKYDVALAKSMLDEIGVVDKNGDGKREHPDGSPLKISLDFQADTGSENLRKNEFLKRDWEAIGLDVQLSPSPPEAWGDRWKNSEFQTTTTWEIGDNQILVYPGWVIPVEPSHWAPMHGQAFILQTGDPKKIEAEAKIDPWKRTPRWILPEEGSPIAKLYDFYAQARVEADAMKRNQLLWEIVKVHINEGPFMMGFVSNYPRTVLVRDGLKNVPMKENLALGGFVNPWIQPSPAVYDPESYFWDKPEEHA